MNFLALDIGRLLVLILALQTEIVWRTDIDIKSLDYLNGYNYIVKLTSFTSIILLEVFLH